MLPSDTVDLADTADGARERALLSEAAASDIAPDIAPPRRGETRTIFIYFAVLIFLLGLGGGLAGLPILFYLKDKLKLGPEQLSAFGVLTGIPSYVGFLFGYLRDRWRPLGRGDRGYLLLTAPATALCYLLLVFLPLTYNTILGVALLSGVIGGIMGAALSGLTASVAQRRLMTGRLTVLSTIISGVPALLASLAGGWLTVHVTPQVTFGICAALMLAVGALGLWRPGAVFDGEPERISREAGEPFRVTFRRFVTHRPLWPSLLLYVLWQIMPGWGTPLLYQMTNTLHINPEQLGVIQAVSPISGAFMGFAYGALCRRLPLRRLLWIGIGISVIMAPSALLIHDITSAILIKSIAILSWAVGGFAMSDLLLRSYPRGLEGTGALLLGGVGACAGNLSDLLGAFLYSHGGFGLAMAATTLSTALMLPALLLVPRALIATRDGEVPKDESPDPALSPAVA